MAEKKIIAICSLCSHEYASWPDAAEQDAHMAETHGMFFDPRPLGPAAR